MKKKRYIILDELRGVFLGTFNAADINPEMFDGTSDKTYACFASYNPFELTTVCSFDSEVVAQMYINDVFPPNKRFNLSIVSVESDSEYPHVVEIIKAGFERYTHDMTDIMFEQTNKTLH